MIRKTILSLGLIATLSIGACANTGGMGGGGGGMGNKEMLGTGLGAVVGGLAGSRFGNGAGKSAFTVAGALLGGMFGNSIGSRLDQADMMYLNQAESRAYAAPIGQSINWRNPQSGNSGTITPVRDGYASGGQYCREYQQSIIIEGQNQTATGTACKQADGSWKVIN